MITFETRVNGTMISHIYARYIGLSSAGNQQYEYEYYQTGDGPRVVAGTVEHGPASCGSMSLLSVIVDDVQAKQRGVSQNGRG